MMPFSSLILFKINVKKKITGIPSESPTVWILSSANILLGLLQGSHRLETYLNIQDCLEKSLKIIFALKST